MKRALATVLVLGLAGVLAWQAPTVRAWWQHDGAAPPPPAAAESRPEPADAPAAIEAPASGMLGVVVPAREVELAATGLARVAELPFATGDAVAENAAVVVLDTSVEEGELRSARAALRAAQAEAERKALEAQRSAAAVARVQDIEGYVAREEIDELRHAEDTALADRRRAGADTAERRARAEAITARIDDAVIRAPFSGRVLQRMVEPGAVVGPGEPIVRIISDELVVRFAAPESEAARMHVDAAVEIVSPDLAQPIATRIASVVPEIDPSTRIVIGEATLPSDAAIRLRPGAIVRVRFAAGH
jgi:RND family efflux transporter MFP subunit